MAIAWLESFADGDQAHILGRYTAAGSYLNLTVVGTAGRDGRPGAQFPANAAGYLNVPMGASVHPGPNVGTWFKIPSLPGAGGMRLMDLRTGTTTSQLQLWLRADGLLEVRRADGTVLGTSTGSAIPTTGVYLEFAATIGDSGGSFRVLRNGALEPGLSLAGATDPHSTNSNIVADTLSSGTATSVNVVSIGPSTDPGLSGPWALGDVYFGNRSGSYNQETLGPMAVLCLRPSAPLGASGEPTQLPTTIVGPDRALALAEADAHDGDASYITHAPGGGVSAPWRSNHALTDLPAWVTHVRAVHADHAVKVLANGGTFFSASVFHWLRSGGADLSVSLSHNTSAYARGTNGMTFDYYPGQAINTPEGWTRAIFEACEWGVGDNDTRHETVGVTRVAYHVAVSDAGGTVVDPTVPPLAPSGPIEMIESFDSYYTGAEATNSPTGKRYVTQGFTRILGAGRAADRYGMSVVNSAILLEFDPPVASTRKAMSSWWLNGSHATTSNWVSLHSYNEGTVYHVVIGLDVTSGAIVARRGQTASSALIATATATPAQGDGVWHYLESDVTVHDTTGRIIVRVDDVVVMDFTGDTRNAGTLGTISRVRLGQTTNPGTAPTNPGYFAKHTEWVCYGSTGLPEAGTRLAVKGFLPTANGVLQEGGAAVGGGTLSSSHVENVEDPFIDSGTSLGRTPNSITADMIPLTAAGQRESYAYNPPLSGITVKAVLASAGVLPPVAASTAAVAAAIARSSGGALVRGTEVRSKVTNAAYQGWLLMNVDPEGAPWTPALVKSTQYGARRMETADAETRMAWVAIEVAYLDAPLSEGASRRRGAAYFFG